MSQYEITGLKQIYDGQCVLDIPAFKVHKGEILAVMGPSGAGKSTLLRLLNFLEKPSQGLLTFEGAPVEPGLPIEKRRSVTTVFQHPLLLKRSVVANLKYGLKLRGMRLNPQDLKNWLERLGLDSLEHQSASKLSGGEAQRVALARALLTRPDVLLLDEPTANLDPYNVKLIENIVRDDNHHRGTTIVIVTHNIFQARRLANRAALLLDGKLVETGKTDQIFTNPGQPETKAFIRGELIY